MRGRVSARSGQLPKPLTPTLSLPGALDPGIAGRGGAADVHGRGLSLFKALRRVCGRDAACQGDGASLLPVHGEKVRMRGRASARSGQSPSPSPQPSPRRSGARGSRGRSRTRNSAARRASRSPPGAARDIVAPQQSRRFSAMLRWSIATVCLGGGLEAKFSAAAKAGFRAVELLENDLTFYAGKARDARLIADDLGLDIVALQPLRDFEGAPEPQRRRNFDRAKRKLELTRELGAPLLCLSSSISEDLSPDVDRIAVGSRRARRSRAPVRFAARLRGVVLGPPHQGLDGRLGGRRQGRPRQSRHRPRLFPYLRAQEPDRADRRFAGGQDRPRRNRRFAGAGDGFEVAQPALSLLSRPGRLSRRRLSRRGAALGLPRPDLAGDLLRAVPRRVGGFGRRRRHAFAASDRRSAERAPARQGGAAGRRARRAAADARRARPRVPRIRGQRH